MKRGSVDKEELSERKGKERRKEGLKGKENEARVRESWRRASPTCPTRSSIIVRDNSSRRDHLLSIRQVAPPRWARRCHWSANKADYNPGGRRPALHTLGWQPVPACSGHVLAQHHLVVSTPWGDREQSNYLTAREYRGPTGTLKKEQYLSPFVDSLIVLSRLE
ncbi:hypothetical protein ASPVEDRAFT_42188 [Aspergillus versicolor CBS 583.65]|uniref:Uncharacterized protein n=1 Tax=Aspergillus versicolor CBS 583.65 TaxID=1036611 RepID=A0A1L9PMB8_ASPVE|nr:uncharacterized protein ASPVEDRAFT_42188 [Aspergillus versicolor CBS 583.65]OJJ02684.1 hypothetical protein ASPVEDRAFT_42188 [Aspergillus versicolor CBS 583.65]